MRWLTSQTDYDCTPVAIANYYKWLGRNDLARPELWADPLGTKPTTGTQGLVTFRVLGLQPECLGAHYGPIELEDAARFHRRGMALICSSGKHAWLAIPNERAWTAVGLREDLDEMLPSMELVDQNIVRYFVMQGRP
jgi:hypothetical protein